LHAPLQLQARTGFSFIVTDGSSVCVSYINDSQLLHLPPVGQCLKALSHRSGHWKKYNLLQVYRRFGGMNFRGVKKNFSFYS
jgi:hypothetical protein